MNVPKLEYLVAAATPAAGQPAPPRAAVRWFALAPRHPARGLPPARGRELRRRVPVLGLGEPPVVRRPGVPADAGGGVGSGARLPRATATCGSTSRSASCASPPASCWRPRWRCRSASLIGAFKVGEGLLQPLTEFVRYIPVPALIPICMVLFGIDELSEGHADLRRDVLPARADGRRRDPPRAARADPGQLHARRAARARSSAASCGRGAARHLRRARACATAGRGPTWSSPSWSRPTRGSATASSSSRASCRRRRSAST